MADNNEQANEQAGAGAENEAPSKRKGDLITFISATMVCVAASVLVGIMAFPDPHGPTAGHDESQKVPTETIELPVPQVLVNLAGNKGHSLLQATVTLELIQTGMEKTPPDINKLLPPVQDQLIKILSSLSKEELYGGVSKEFIQTRIKDLLNRGALGDRPVEVINVYFLEFVIQ